MMLAVEWSDVSHAGAFVLGVIVGMVVVLQLARYGARVVDRYIDHRLERDRYSPSSSSDVSTSDASAGSTRFGSGRSGDTSKGSGFGVSESGSADVSGSGSGSTGVGSSDIAEP